MKSEAARSDAKHAEELDVEPAKETRLSMLPQAVESGLDEYDVYGEFCSRDGVGHADDGAVSQLV